MLLAPSQDCTDPLLPLLLNLPQKYMLRLRENPFYELPWMFAPAYRRDRTRYCEFHNDHGHDTNDYVDLQKEIETCVRNGRLSHLAKGAKAQNSSQNLTSSSAAEKGKNQPDWKQKVVAPKAGNEVLMIDEGWSPPHYQQNGLRLNTDISFTSDDPVPEHCSGDDPLLDNKTKASLRLLTSPLVGFSGQVLWPLGVITASFTFSDYAGKGSVAIIRGDMPQKNICLQISRKRERECETIVILEPPGNETEKENVVINTMYPDQPVGIGTRLPARIKQELQRILCENKDIFAWYLCNMTGIPRELAKHKLNIHLFTFPVRQKKRVLAKDRNEAVTAEVDKLVEARILKEVYFLQWVANPTVYPIREDQKIESLDGFRYKFFLDAYKGYHQIRMAEEDEEKTTFYMEQGTFCYEKMPFGLKNAGATYQRLTSQSDKYYLRPENSGRLAKLAIELGEHDISYKLRRKMKTLIAGLGLSIRLEVHHLQVFTDSLLVTNHVKGTYEAREESMKRYIAKVQSLQERFKSFSITQIPHSKNKRANALSKLASSSFVHLTKKVLVEIIPCRSIDMKTVNTVEEPETTWMDPIINYLRDGRLLEDPVATRKIRFLPPVKKKLEFLHNVSSYDEHKNDEDLRLNLDLLEERRDLAALREARYKQQMEQYYNSKVHQRYLKVGDFVLRKKLGMPNRRGKDKIDLKHRKERAISNSRVKTSRNVHAQKSEREVDPKNMTH
ncbi:reverse transcriptase domain-containing protein [Tanacetum coccineum]